MLDFVLGGARSGKSRWAENAAMARQMPVTYIATATAGDGEMHARIVHHQQRRPDDWTLCEEPLHLANVLRAEDAPEKVLLVDCLTLWISNVLFNENSMLFERERDALLATLPRLQAHVILVSNEIGLGVVPMGPETRRYVDELGRLHQDIAAIADRVVFVVAGLPQYLKGSSA